MTRRWFAGLGSRKTPEPALRILRAATIALHRRGYGLRSGGSGVADLACEEAMLSVGGETQIFLPWKNFDKRKTGIPFEALPVAAECYRIAQAHHPRWDDLVDKPGARKLLARDALPVLGPDLVSPSAFVLVWAKRPVLNHRGFLMDCHGGTGHAVRIAHAYGIPAFNLAVPEHLQRVAAFCGDDLEPDLSEIA